MPPKPFVGPSLLYDDLVQLEALSAQHVPDLIALAADPNLWAYALAPMNTEADVRQYLEEAMHGMINGTFWAFAIRDRRSGLVAGSARFGEISTTHRRLQIGWTWLASPFQGSGLNPRMKFLLLEWAFREWGANRVELKADSRNARSIAAMRKLGATYEGTLRQHLILPDGFVRDSVYFSYIHSEWPSVAQKFFGAIATESPAKT